MTVRRGGGTPDPPSTRAVGGDEPLHALEVLGDELDRVVRADHRRRRSPWTRTGLLATVLVLFGAGVAVAAGLVLGTGDPIDPPARVDRGTEVRPAPGSGVLAGVPSPDPDGAPAWDVRIATAAGGQVCTAVGQRFEGAFGIAGLDRRFRALPVGVTDTCGVRPTGAQVQVGARLAVGSGALGPRTVVAGVVGPDARTVSVAASGHPAQVVRIGRGRGFVRAFAGYLEELRPVVRVTTASGAVRTTELADTGKDTVPDPDGLAPWQVEVGRDGCAQVQQVKASQAQATRRDFPELFTDIVCRASRGGPLMLAMRRVGPVRSEPQPTRTIVWGVAGRGVRALELRVPGRRPRPLAIGRHGRSVLAVLDPRVDPRRVVVRARTSGGDVLVQRGSTALRDRRGRRVREPTPPPASTSTPDELARKPVQELSRPVPGTLRTSAPQADPAGGDPWVLQTYASRPRDRRALRADGRTFAQLHCSVVGRLRDGVVRAPGSTRPIVRDDRIASCGPALRGEEPIADVVAYAGDPTSYAPGVGSLVLTGRASGARAVEVRGARGGPRPLRVERGGAFLAVLTPSDVPGDLRVRATYPDGTTNDSRPVQSGRGAPARVDVRVADPGGGAPWVLQARRQGRGSCVVSGQLVDGRIVSIDAATGAVRPGGVGSSCFPAGPAFRDLSFNLRPIPGGTAEVTPAQAELRTLSGRTVITGVARPGTTALRIRTPRDVRTVRPAGPRGAYLVVYDGALTSGTVQITPYRGTRPGKTVTYPIFF